jgi:D-alanine-D-alanine ligase
MQSLSIGVLVGASPVSSSIHARDEGAGQALAPRDSVLDRQSGADILESLAELGHRPRLIQVDEVDENLSRTDVDACFLALHGKLGGSGRIQAALAKQRIPFAGADAAAATLAFDKVRSRKVLAHHNLPVPASVVLGKDVPGYEQAVGLLGWPCVVKPRRGSLGVGVTHLHHAAQVGEALENALDLDGELVVERAVDGEEIQVVLMGERVLGAMQVDRSQGSPCSPPCMMTCPPQLSSARLDGIFNLSRRAVHALELEHTIARVDVILSPRRNEVVLEVEPLPPLHRTGVVARAARTTSMEHPDLLALMLSALPLGAADMRGAEIEARVLQ